MKTHLVDFSLTDEEETVRVRRPPSEKPQEKPHLPPLEHLVEAETLMDG